MLWPINKWGLFGGSPNGFECVFHDERLWREPTATVVQRTFDELAEPVLAWATFPLHPYKPGLELSNRAPKRDEIALGMDIVLELLTVLEPQRVAGMGNIAAVTLFELGIFG